MTPEKLNSEHSRLVTLVRTVWASASSSEDTKQNFQSAGFQLKGSVMPLSWTCVGLPAVTCTDSRACVMLRLHTCKLWTSVTPLTDSSCVLTLSTRTSRGVPAQRQPLVSLTLPNKPPSKAFLPSISILKTSFVTGTVVPRTRAENRNVQIGSAALYSGCEEHKSQK